jgi:hypothetical protein
MQKYIDGVEGGKFTDNGEKYYEEFKNKFYEKPGKYYYFILNVL